MPTDLLTRLEQRRSRPAAREWYRIQAADGDSKTVTVHIYDEIGIWGTTARDFARELGSIDAQAIELHLNSPGGDAFDGIAIYNSLRDHPATVTVIVDGLAASAASVIAMAGDTIRMNVGAQMMIHEASGVVIGNAGDMADFASVLGKASDSIAATYVAKAGGTVAEWREVMRAETWYTAAEAVDAGLADELVAGEAEPVAKANWDLKVFAYAYDGRDAAPDPTIHRRPAPTPVTAAEAARRIHAAATKTPTAEAATGQTEGGSMDPAKIREALGLSADASDDQVFAALTATRAVTPPEAPQSPTATAPAPQVDGTMQIDVSAWQAQQERLSRLEAEAARRRRDERDQVLAQAVQDGKFAPARTEHWTRLWDADPEGTRQVVDSLAKNVIPVAELGYSADSDGSEFDDEFAKFFPPEPTRKGA
ncbi:head maturation protease, ClpP-related [Micromonospora tarensis]|uniref:ATP-dependent Clp protease proteolytic subunit n=1 Tax=Micromonospora tarensis TaxID=2806100 RepID=A0ABS1YK64_9ACTN|nr:head maturation protease, ClpP-related [Micromonospora tarensis]MBM0277819.1 ATP-dependent Clp protease proteolytic subunit [Micromonospora tarensis]